MSRRDGHAGIERTDAMDTALLEGQGHANAEWRNDVEGLTAVYESMVSTPGTSSMLFKTAGPQVSQSHSHHLLVSPSNVLYVFWIGTEPCTLHARI